jgi:hypothetical protein
LQGRVPGLPIEEYVGQEHRFNPPRDVYATMARDRRSRKRTFERTIVVETREHGYVPSGKKEWQYAYGLLGTSSLKERAM